MPSHWDRLIVSRWDAQHYEALGLRGYTTCRDKSQLGSGEFPDDDQSCELNFYQTYGFIGAVVMRLTHWPIDYSLYYVSLAASFVFILLWTGREMRDGLGGRQHIPGAASLCVVRHEALPSSPCRRGAVSVRLDPRHLRLRAQTMASGRRSAGRGCNGHPRERSCHGILPTALALLIITLRESLSTLLALGMARSADGRFGLGASSR